ncbi:CRISPR-associated endonuclease Cas1 [Methanospirillum hungatei]|uniref:CRISPR-associated endonuclease Cas1 n=1 Tax=Methanospirillum hungatei TaxID=2203 RepID=UPI0026F2471C|nr:CRISPR-associated endonuclease Cas1 [Methanospirillum hungatei]MCA1916312.1 CRISPR-associated endonuclease Cas1 [Methanospirillum hungatei]
MTIPWRIVGGFGAHIKSNRTEITIQHKGKITEIPIKDLSHFLLIGGHTIQTSTITSLVKEGVFISFCESDGEPVGYISPYDYSLFKEIQHLQKNVAPYSYALACATESIKSRILAIEKYAEEIGQEILFSGELDILTGYAKELENMVLIEELRRIEQLVRDMYYEILGRLISPTYLFKRRTSRPYLDPVNAIFSFGYGMLSSACTRAVIGGHLDPGHGYLNRGNQALVQDLMNCWKPDMIDAQVIAFLRSGRLDKNGYERTKDRCILQEEVIEELIYVFSQSIQEDRINSQIDLLIRSLRGEEQFSIIKT